MADTKIQECSSPMYIDKMAEYSTTMKQTAQFKKWQEKLNRFFFPQRRQKANKHMKRCSISLFIREMQIKTKIKYHLLSVVMAIIKKARN